MNLALRSIGLIVNNKIELCNQLRILLILLIFIISCKDDENENLPASSNNKLVSCNLMEFIETNNAKNSSIKSIYEFDDNNRIEKTCVFNNDSLILCKDFYYIDSNSEMYGLIYNNDSTSQRDTIVKAKFLNNKIIERIDLSNRQIMSIFEYKYDSLSGYLTEIIIPINPVNHVYEVTNDSLGNPLTVILKNSASVSPIWFVSIEAQYGNEKNPLKNDLNYQLPVIFFGNNMFTYFKTVDANLNIQEATNSSSANNLRFPTESDIISNGNSFTWEFKYKCD